MISDIFVAIGRLASQAEFWMSLAGLFAGTGLGLLIKAALLLRRSRGLARLSGAPLDSESRLDVKVPGAGLRGAGLIMAAFALACFLTTAILFSKTEPDWLWLSLCFLTSALLSTLLAWAWWPSVIMLLVAWFLSAAYFQSNLRAASLQALAFEAAKRPIASLWLEKQADVPKEEQAEESPEKWIWRLDYRDGQVGLVLSAEELLAINRISYKPDNILRLIYGPDWVGLFTGQSYESLSEAWRLQADTLTFDKRRKDGFVWKIFAHGPAIFEKKN